MRLILPNMRYFKVTAVGKAVGLVTVGELDGVDLVGEKEHLIQSGLIPAPHYRLHRLWQMWPGR